MTLYQFNLLSKILKIITIFDKGIFLDNYKSEIETLNCYALDMFFVELVYDSEINKIVDVRSFVSGWCLDKYSENIKTEY